MLNKLQRMMLRHQINQKWKRDVTLLPLYPQHRDLYEVIHRFCWAKMRDFPNLVKCRDFNDRIQWLKLFDQRPEQIKCVDKIGVRGYVEERLGKGYTPLIIQEASSFDRIDFSSLPSSFVLKTNHDSGTAVLVRDKFKFDLATHAKLIKQSLSRPWSWESGEWAYSYVEPKVFIEEALPCGPNQLPSDYKFHCVDGEVKFMHFVFDDMGTNTEQVIDIDGRDTGLQLKSNWPYGNQFERPDNWNQLKSVAETLSKGWKYVRVDLYSIAGKISVGEMTFWPFSGAYPGEGQKPLGQLIDFDRSTFRACIASAGLNSEFRTLSLPNLPSPSSAY